MPLPSHEITQLQKALNNFTDKRLRGVTRVVEDGDKGPATKKRIREAKFFLGYEQDKIDSTADEDFLWRLRNPLTAKEGVQGKPAIRRGQERRDKQHEDAKANEQAARDYGVGTFDGKPVANWLIPYLQWAREHGWQGYVTSGWRDPAYSEQLCLNMCGAPSCPGRCAGRASNHSGSDKPRGALDVTDYTRFGQLMEQCPYEPRIFNGLDDRDPVHFSATGN